MGDSEMRVEEVSANDLRGGRRFERRRKRSQVDEEVIEVVACDLVSVTRKLF